MTRGHPTGTDLVLMLARSDVFPFVGAEVERACALGAAAGKGCSGASRCQRGAAPSVMIGDVPGHGD